MDGMIDVDHVEPMCSGYKAYIVVGHDASDYSIYFSKKDKLLSCACGKKVWRQTVGTVTEVQNPNTYENYPLDQVFARRLIKALRDYFEFYPCCRACKNKRGY